MTQFDVGASKGIAAVLRATGLTCLDGTNRNSAWLSTNLVISQGQATRST
jgi:hypothetical protein